MVKKRSDKQKEIQVGQSRREFLKLFAIGGGITILALASGDIVVQILLQSGKKVEVKMSADALSHLGTLEQNIIIDAVNKYIKKFGAIIDSVNIDVVSHPIKFKNNEIVTTLEDATPGIINLDPSIVNDDQEIRFIIEHAMGHANQKAASKMFNSVYFLNAENLINSPTDIEYAYGIQGFSVLVDNNGKKTAFWVIEEGVCDALAKSLDPNYFNTNHHYINVMNLTLDLINKHGFFTPEEVAIMMQNSDLMGFVKKIFNITEDNYYYLEKLMQYYQNAWDLVDIDSIEMEMLSYRSNSFDESYKKYLGTQNYTYSKYNLSPGYKLNEA